jgi:sarcosine oxidase subunit gamma
MVSLEINPDAAANRALVHLRISSADAAHAAEQLKLPTVSGRWSGTDPQALWLGPDHWLLLGERISAVQLIVHCRNALPGILHHAADSSDALTCFSIAGQSAHRLLAMGSGVDFDPGVFPAGSCVSTRYAKVAAIIRALAGQQYELFTDRSVGAYVAMWLARAASDPQFRP